MDAVASIRGGAELFRTPPRPSRALRILAAFDYRRRVYVDPLDVSSRAQPVARRPPRPRDTLAVVSSTTRISARIAAIAESATLKVDAKAKALQAQGRPVISYAAGEPDFTTPQHIVEAASAAA
jgi:aspartate aminotransferase